jgi:hypothetical protein
MKNSLAVIGFFIFLFQGSFAGGFKVGDGGAGVDCEDSGMVLYDRWEAKIILKNHYSDFQYDFSKCKPDDIFCYKIILSQIIEEKLSNSISSQLLWEIKSLVWSLSIQIAKLEMPNISMDQDITLLSRLPKLCHIVQLGMYDPLTHKTVLSPILYKMSSTDKALLILHEALHGYFHHASQQEYSSDNVRQFIWYILADNEFKEMNQSEFAKLFIDKLPFFLGLNYF